MNRRMRWISLVPALTIVAALGAATPARAAQGMELALQDDAVFVDQSYVKHKKGFQLLAELRVNWLRVNIGWANVVGPKAARARSKPRNLAYNWHPYEVLVKSAQANGVQLEVGLTGPAPAWAAGNKKSGPYKPSAKHFRDFVRDAATHFRGTVSRYSIWNEPNHTGWLAPLKSQASLYRSLYAAGYGAIKAADPGAEVLIGETAPYASRRGVATPPLKFVRDLTKSGQLKADGFAHHPYDFAHAPTYKFPGKDNVTMSGLSKLTKLLDSLAASNRLETPDGRPLDLYLTEFGYMRSGRFKQNESTRSKWLRQAYDMALENSRVRQMLHYLLAQPAKKYLFFDTSITSRSGGKTATFKALADWASDNASRLSRR